LRGALNDKAHRDEAVGIIRSLIDRIVVSFSDGKPVIDLQGELAGILALAVPIKAVAGARNRRSHHYTVSIWP
jgi:hypothetical protein